MQPVSQEHIQISPDVRSGKPRISGTRTAVEDMAIMHLKQSLALIEIAGKYDLSLASVYAAMVCYFDHRIEIDRRTTEERNQVEALKQQTSSRLPEKLTAYSMNDRIRFHLDAMRQLAQIGHCDACATVRLFSRLKPLDLRVMFEEILDTMPQFARPVAVNHPK